MAAGDKRPLAPCKCSECRHRWDTAGVCSKMPFSRTPPEKKCGCLYYEKRGASDVLGK